MQGDPPAVEPTGSISVASYGEIRDWCTRLGCTEVELAEAIALVGYSPELVRAFLADPTRQPSSG
jgi:uncharacterized protein DUF3606